MYVTDAGDKIFVIDAHVHVWDARPENRRNRYGQTFIDTFYGGSPIAGELSVCAKCRSANLDW